MQWYVRERFMLLWQIFYGVVIIGSQYGGQKALSGYESVFSTHRVYQCCTCAASLLEHTVDWIGLPSSPTYHFYHPQIVIMLNCSQVEGRQTYDNMWDTRCEICMHLAVKCFRRTAALGEAVTIRLKCKLYLRHLFETILQIFFSE